MALPSQSAPAVVSLPRLTTLAASLLVALSSGTNYAFSGYAPQLSARLHITHTQLNAIALAGNVGVYSSSPFWGRIVDARGPRILLVGAFLFLLTGYSGIRRIYDNGVPMSDSKPTSLPTLTFCILVLCSLFTGIGGGAGLSSSVNSTAKTFPDKARATTTGIVLSGFGLSAFFFSTLAHFVFAGDTSSFLLVLSLGTAFPMILGFFFIRTIPLPASELVSGLEHGTSGARHGEDISSSSIFQNIDDSRSRLLSDDDGSEEMSRTSLSNSSVEYVSNALEMSPTRSPPPDIRRHRSRSNRRSLSRAAKMINEDILDISGRALWRSSDFWLLFTILSILSGTGLMYINNVGSMSQALYAKGNPFYDNVEAARLQAAQVSSISIMNFSGRIFIGLVSDFSKNYMGYPRSYCLVLVSIFFVLSQVAAANVDGISNLWKVSALLGLAHGSVFGLFPTVCIEWFGLPHFSENWGYLSLSPMLAGNLFSMAFGRNLDAHEPKEHQSPFSPAESPPSHQCLEGRQCYVDTLHITIVACLLATALSAWAAWTDRRKISDIGSRRADVVWADNED